MSDSHTILLEATSSQKLCEKGLGSDETTQSPVLVNLKRNRNLSNHNHNCAFRCCYNRQF